MAQMFTFTTFIVKLSRHCVSKYKHYICLHNVHLTREEEPNVRVTDICEVAGGK